VHHVEAYSTWREWIDKGVLHAPFTVIHVDAHSDLGSGGLGNTSPKFIETESLIAGIRVWDPMH
jgi:arginase family enzyme